MFEIKKNESINKTFRLPAALVRQMEEIAQNKGVSLNNLMVMLVEQGVHPDDIFAELQKRR